MKAAEELIREIKEVLQNTEEGSDAGTLDEAINEVLDMIDKYHTPRTFEYTFIMDDVEMFKGNVEAKDEAAAEAKAKEILGDKVKFTRYVITEIK
jgi:hypothetical protein